MDDYTEPDIRTCVKGQLRPSIQLSEFSLITEIVRKALGVFFWVVLVVRSLVKARDEGESINRMRQIVRDIPEQLNQLIKQIILSVSVEHRLETLRIMQWVLFASKQLNTTELRYASVFGRDPAHVLQALATISPNFVGSDSKMEMLIRSRTKGLVEVKQRKADLDYLKPSRYGPKYLNNHGLQILESSLSSSTIIQSHFYLAKTYINYLGISELQDLAASSSEPSTLATLQAEDIFNKLCNSYPFLEYVVTAIFHHAKKAESSSCETNSMFGDSLMTDMQRVFNVWRHVSDLERKISLRQISGPHTTFAHIAAEYNMIDWVGSLLRQGVHVNITGDIFHTLIQTASAMGHEKLVNDLLESGADAYLRGGRHENVLTAAAYYGNPAIVKAILAKGVDVNALGGEYMTVLQAAAGSLEGSADIVRLLLDENADVHVQGGKHSNALQAGAFKGNEEIVQLLLDAGADVNAQGGEHGSPLQAAPFQGHEFIVRTLLENDADVTIRAGNYGTALWAAAYSGNANIVRQILAFGHGHTSDITCGEDSSLTSNHLECQVQEVMKVSKGS